MIAVLYLLSMLYAWTFERLAQTTGSELYAMLGRQLPGQLSYFMVGALWYYYLGFLERHAWKLVVAAVAMCILQRAVPGWPLAVLEPIWLGTLVASLGVARYAGNFGRHGDFSYGIYILHFPVLQALVQLGAFAWSPLGALAIACASVLGAAVLLWHVVERPFLQRGSHYVLVASKKG